MSRRFIPRRRALLAAFLLAAAGPARAHRLDECLQAAFVGVHHDRITVELNFTPGVEVAPAFLAALDRDADGEVTAAEAGNWFAGVLLDLALELDGRPLALRAGAPWVPQPADLRGGDGVVRVELTADCDPPAAGEHRVRFVNRHRAVPSVHLVNALRPVTPDIRILAQRRDDAQTEAEITFTVADAPAAVPPASGRPALGAGQAVAALAALTAAGAAGLRRWRGLPGANRLAPVTKT
jgi:hypothetical protein